MEFDVDDFRTIYPQFTMFTDAQLTFMAANALIISELDQNSCIPATQKRNLWYMLTCHLATLADRGTAGALVSAAEGTVGCYPVTDSHRLLEPAQHGRTEPRSQVSASDMDQHHQHIHRFRLLVVQRRILPL